MTDSLKSFLFVAFVSFGVYIVVDLATADIWFSSLMGCFTSLSQFIFMYFQNKLIDNKNNLIHENNKRNQELIDYWRTRSFIIQDHINTIRNLVADEGQVTMKDIVTVKRNMTLDLRDLVEKHNVSRHEHGGKYDH